MITGYTYDDYKIFKENRNLPNTALGYVLISLIPYTKPNLKLSFAPKQFFDDLGQIQRNRDFSKHTIRKAYYTAKRDGYIMTSQSGVGITAKGQAALRPFKPQKLTGAKILVVFDIPEEENYKRRELRSLLRELKFMQVQKSVWSTEYECRKILNEFVATAGLGKYVQLFEATSIH